MSKFIRVTTGNYLIVHGFDANNKEIIEEVNVAEKTVKIVAIKRIQSISEKYILVNRFAWQNDVLGIRGKF